jgi:hypothetical protein
MQLKKLLKYILSLLFFLLVFEGLLRITGLLKTDNEKSGNGYQNRYYFEQDTWFHGWQANTTFEYTQEEFSFTNTVNELGHREKSFEDFKNDSTSVKIVCLGDSFTEGDGAPYDSSWVRRLEQLLNEYFDTTFLLYNAGVCGSDVFFTNKILEDRLMASNPYMVLEAINESDLTDIVYRGGEERFNQDGTTSGKVGPNWEKHYKLSHVFRFYMTTLGGYSKHLIKRKEALEIESKSLELLTKQIAKTHEFCLKNEVDYFIIPHPVPSWFENEMEEIFILFMQAFLDSEYGINVYKNMFKYYDQNNIREYRWENNGHFNSKGYFIMGDIIFEKLAPYFKEKKMKVKEVAKNS